MPDGSVNSTGEKAFPASSFCVMQEPQILSNVATGPVKALHYGLRSSGSRGDICIKMLDVATANLGRSSEVLHDLKRRVHSDHDIHFD